MIVTDAPCPASSVASSKAEVDLPAPPLELAKEMVGIGKTRIGYCLPENDDCWPSVGQLTADDTKVVCQTTVACKTTVACLPTVVNFPKDCRKGQGRGL